MTKDDENILEYLETRNQFYSNSVPSECHTLIVGEFKDLTLQNQFMWAFSETLAPEERTEFEKGWKAGHIASCDNLCSIETVNRNIDEFKEGLRDDLDALTTALGKQFAEDEEMREASVKGLIVGIDPGILQGAAFVAQTYFDLLVTDKYSENMPKNLDEFRDRYDIDNDDGRCAGTSLIIIFLSLGVLIVSMHREKRRYS